MRDQTETKTPALGRPKKNRMFREGSSPQWKTDGSMLGLRYGAANFFYVELVVVRNVVVSARPPIT